MLRNIMQKTQNGSDAELQQNNLELCNLKI